jgi:hypothetical protein
MEQDACRGLILFQPHRAGSLSECLHNVDATSSFSTSSAPEGSVKYVSGMDPTIEHPELEHQADLAALLIVVLLIRSTCRSRSPRCSAKEVKRCQLLRKETD